MTVWNFCTCSSDIVSLGKSTGGTAVLSDLFEILGHNILVCRQIMPYQTAGGKIKEEWAEAWAEVLILDLKPLNQPSYWSNVVETLEESSQIS